MVNVTVLEERLKAVGVRNCGGVTGKPGLKHWLCLQHLCGHDLSQRGRKALKRGSLSCFDSAGQYVRHVGNSQATESHSEKLSGLQANQLKSKLKR